MQHSHAHIIVTPGMQDRGCIEQLWATGRGRSGTSRFGLVEILARVGSAHRRDICADIQPAPAHQQALLVRTSWTAMRGCRVWESGRQLWHWCGRAMGASTGSRIAHCRLCACSGCTAAVATAVMLNVMGALACTASMIT